MSSMNTTCLQDASSTRTVISLQMCGNGIVEQGEDCDPGSGRNSTCCDSATCKFTANSVCDPTHSTCCTSSCQLAPSTQVCRPALDSACDLQESCSGTSADCPVDHVKSNGTPCGEGLACASGTCTSRDRMSSVFRLSSHVLIMIGIGQCQAVGVSLDLKMACKTQNDKTCSVSCQDPTKPNQCVVLQTPLLDGTPCGEKYSILLYTRFLLKLLVCSQGMEEPVV